MLPVVQWQNRSIERIEGRRPEPATSLTQEGPAAVAGATTVWE